MLNTKLLVCSQCAHRAPWNRANGIVQNDRWLFDISKIGAYKLWCCQYELHRWVDNHTILERNWAIYSYRYRYTIHVRVYAPHSHMLTSCHMLGSWSHMCTVLVCLLGYFNVENSILNEAFIDCRCDSPHRNYTWTSERIVRIDLIFELCQPANGYYRIM